MIGLDTNILVRYLVGDDPEQTRRAAALIARTEDKGERLFVPQVVLCEVVWVLNSVYRFSHSQITAVLRDLLRARQLFIEDLDTSRRALDRFAERGGDFADYLILERCHVGGCERVASFDRGLAEEPGVFQP